MKRPTDRSLQLTKEVHRLVLAQEYPLKLEVSKRIRQMPFLWLDVADAPTTASDRGVTEAGAIRLLTNFGRELVVAGSCVLRLARTEFRQEQYHSIRLVECESRGRGCEPPLPRTYEEVASTPKSRALVQVASARVRLI